MTSLLDIAPLTEKVTVGGVEIECRGINAKAVATLLQRFPDMRKVMSGMDVDPVVMVGLLPDAVASIIAAGTGSPGDAEAEAAAEALPVEAQLDLLGAVMKLTMPAGIGPFVEKLTAFMGAVGGGPTTMALAGKLPAQ